MTHTAPVRIGLLNPVVDTGAIDVEAMLAPLRGPGLEIEMLFLTSGPTSIETEEDVAACLPGALQVGAQLASRGVQALVINCMCDPAVSELRALHAMPVLGPAQASMHAIAAMGLKFSVLDVLGEAREMVEAQVREHGVTRNFVSHRSIQVPVLQLYADVERTSAMLEREALSAVSDGANALLLGCTGLAELAGALSGRLKSRGVQALVIEPLRTTIALARNMLEAQAIT